jgi:hypothetical protein
MDNRQNPITNEGGIKLYPLLVKDESVIDLIELINDESFHEPPTEPDDDDASTLLSWCFWALLIVTPLGMLYLLGLTVGSGN